MSVQTIKGFFNRKECALIVRNLWDRRVLWESREDRKVNYRNGQWFTLGSTLYLDLKDESGFVDYQTKVDYFNQILESDFGGMLDEVKSRLKKHFGIDVKFLSEVFKPAGLPGFHIFGPEETNQVFFGKVHQDKQWEALLQMPNFPFPKLFDCEVWSFTIPLVLPFLGGGMNYGGEVVSYSEGDCYMHDGLTDHSIAPYVWPVLPMDWRVSIQAHGIEHQGCLYLYW